MCVCVLFGNLCLDRPNVQDHDLVERLQQPYVDALRSYIMIKRPNVSGQSLIYSGDHQRVSITCLSSCQQAHGVRAEVILRPDWRIIPIVRRAVKR